MTLTCFLVGDESLLVQCAAAFMRRGHQIKGVITSSAPVARWSEQNGIPCLEPNSESYAHVVEAGCDVLFSIANLRVLPRDVVEAPRVASINFHDGPLPRRSGLNVTTWAIAERDNHHAVTWHLMTKAVDEGHIVATRDIEIVPDETAFSLNVKCYEAGLESFEDVLDNLESGVLDAKEQEGDGVYFSRKKRPHQAAILDWRQESEKLFALVRALDFGTYANPVSTVKLLAPSGEILRVVSATTETDLSGQSGEVLQIDDEAITVATVDSALRLVLSNFEERQSLDFESLGISEGVVLPMISTETGDRLQDAVEGCVSAESFWHDQIKSYTPTRLPYKRDTAEGDAEIESLGLNSAEGLRALRVLLGMLQERCSTQEAFAVTFALYLCKASNVDSASFGLSDCQLAENLRGILPVLSRSVPVRVACDRSLAVKDAAAEVAEALKEIRGMGAFTVDLLVRFPDLPSHLRHEIVLDYTGLQHDADLVIHISEDGQSSWHYKSASYSKAAIERMQGEFSRVLHQVTNNLDCLLSDVELLSSDERQKLQFDWNNTSVDVDLNTTIPALFEKQVRVSPHATAVHDEHNSWTYEVLNARANQLAHALLARGVSKGDRVGVFTERSAWMVASLLGIMKAGAAYVPLDPEFPVERLSFMVEDATLAAIVADSAPSSPSLEPTVPLLTINEVASDSTYQQNPENDPEPTDLAYILYTSGSTGKPKGVMVEHRNVVNFFAGMDSEISVGKEKVWLAGTSISFDISVLELLWTLTRGFTVVIQQPEQIGRPRAKSTPPISYSLFYFASDEGSRSGDSYKLLLEGTRFADENGFEAVWTPERHFHAFGGLYPNPSVASAALSTITKNVKLRAGSCVSPLHHPARIAEEWSVVDVLSGGRTGISFAAGWQPNDFVIRPEGFSDRKELMFEQIEQVKALWRGETINFPGHDGEPVSIQTLPRPVQEELPVWITAAGNPETFREAGARGYHILTHLLGQRVVDLAEKIEIYREARKANGHDPEAGQVTLMLHTFVGNSDDEVRELVREPMKAYLKSSIGLIKAAAWSFPTFKQKTTGDNGQFSVEHLSEQALDEVLDFSFERYYETSALFGTKERCLHLVRELQDIGVNEIACLIDYGVESDQVLAMLPALNELREASNETDVRMSSVSENIARYGVTHFQCTPTQASLLAHDQESLHVLGSLEQLLIGGETLSGDLSGKLKRAGIEHITNMYGPTETTIWSSTRPVSGDETGVVPLGKPIANTQFYVLDDRQRFVPTGVTGELWIGGDGVSRGYWERGDLTAERFKQNPYADGRMYRTGDLVRYSETGELEFLGRTDFQVKIRGYRIELGEIEAKLSTHSDIREAAVVVREDEPGDVRLVGYFTPQNGVTPDREALRNFLREQLPDYMVPTAFMVVDQFPMTPNQKLDRNALPRPVKRSSISETSSQPSLSVESDTEKEILAIWEDILDVRGINPTSNFFDLGGHSLLAMQVQARLKDDLGHEVRIVDLFRFPTIRLLTQHLNGNGHSEEKNTVAEGVSRGARRAALLSRRTN